MKSRLLIMTALAAGASFAATVASAQSTPTAVETRANETPAQRAKRLANDAAHSTAHAHETRAQRAQRLAADTARSMAAERNEVPIAADTAAEKRQLALDAAHSTAHANETTAQRAQRLADDRARSLARKHHA